MIDDGAGDGRSMANESSALSLSGRLLSFFFFKIIHGCVCMQTNIKFSHKYMFYLITQCDVHMY